jgi:hypothetical protein
MPEEALDEVGQSAPRPKLSALFTRLIEEGGAFLRAELLLYRVQITSKASSAGIIVALFAVAIMLAQAVIVSLLVGLIMVLAPIVGTGWAVVVVTLSACLMIAVCVLIARAKISGLMMPKEPS